MQILITQGRSANTRVLNLSRVQLALAATGLLLVLLLLAGLMYHWVFLKAAREGWPVVSQVVRMVNKNEMAQRDRYVRENLDVMAQKVGELQAKLVRLDAISARVSGMAGVKPAELEGLQRAPLAAASSPQGGPFVAAEHTTFEQLREVVAALDVAADLNADVFTLAESHLMASRLQALMVPSSLPVDGAVGSGFGFRSDPFTGRAALHTGLDFPAMIGVPVKAAAGGVVVTLTQHPAYGNMLELDHGNGLVTRYAHLSRFGVQKGDIVRRDQVVGEVGSTGRSTGPHLHFEVLVEGVQQDPRRFLGARATEHADAASHR